MNIMKQILVSFISPKKMALFRFQGIGKTIGYVFLLMFISTLPIGVTLGYDIQKWVSALKNEIIPEVPEFTIENGSLLTANKEKYTFNENGLEFIFDPTGETSPNDQGLYPNGIGMLEKEIIINRNGDIQSFPYSTFATYTLKKENIMYLLDYLSNLLFIIIPVLYSFIYLLLTAFKFIGVTGLAAIAMIIKFRLWPKLTFKHLWVISAYVVTIPTVFFSIIDTLAIALPIPFVIYWSTAILILLLVLNEIPRQKKLS